MLRRLRRLLTKLIPERRRRDEGHQALKEARRSLENARSRDEEIKTLTNRLHEHGRRNHFGERIIQAATRGA